MKKIKKPVSILLSIIMVCSLFTIVPLSASASVGDVLSEDDYLTFTAETDGSTVTLNVASGNNLQYDLNGAGLNSYTAGTEITLENEGDYVRFSGTGTKYSTSKHFSITGKVACSGNVMSLRLNGGKVQVLEDYCFQYMFYNCTGLTTAPELPETTLADRCYYGMFQGCTSLTKAPDLPATALAKNCYGYMFYGCKSLTELPELPATNLAYGCYSYMFSGCKSLTELPALPATTLEGNCYRNMFEGCTSLTELPALPATTLAASCYFNMFNGCTKIRISDEAGTFDGINYSVEYRIPTTGEGTSASNALNDMFTGTGGKFTGTPNINTTYYLPAPAPTYTVTWKNWNDDILETDENVAAGTTPTYDGATPVRPEDMNNTYTFAAWDDGTTPYVLGVDDLPPVAGDVTYTAVFNDRPKHQAGYYVVGTMTNWKIDDNYLLTKNDAAQGDEYMLNNVAFTAYTAFKVVKYEAGQDWKWYPDPGDDYTITSDGTYNVYFRPNGDGGEDWYEHVIFALNVSTYTVTWKNWDGTVLETDENVLIGSTPTYDGATPVRPEDMNNTYTFAAWDDGKTTYVLGVDDLPPVAGDVTYTAVYTGETKPLFAGHSVTLGGDIGVNYFIDGNVAGVANAQTAVVKFAWDGGKYIQEVNLKKLTPNADGIYKVTINVAAAQMAHRIEATAYINSEMIYTVDLFSVQEYAETVYYDADQPEQLRSLAAAILHYGSEAQTVFDSYLYSHPDRADSNLDSAADYSAVTADAVAAAINGEASDLAAVAPNSARSSTPSRCSISRRTHSEFISPRTAISLIPRRSTAATTITTMLPRPIFLRRSLTSCRTSR